MARELAPAGSRSGPENISPRPVGHTAFTCFTTAAPPSGSKLPRHRCSFSIWKCSSPQGLARKLHPADIRRFSVTGLWRIGCVAWFCCWPFWRLAAA
ncbi:hypothetical protein C1Y08_21460 [Pseudomonas sp. FW306-02-F02-AA]|nr:hypothetical protein C1Y07_17560 [Pseudomonas sp. FW306-02-F02-AB]PMZ08504.1 hypothetical protein C1Y06_19010 [Pseudomonas sp. FW306-02-H06C]PMZ13914.1 hypothetical protein C1Y08_21460 [Pseudomonas sp. FW306-02-F02-AA]PMZ20594.1 hypothetical protein C1Y09_18010 [Pseudomonas sp. FW306-02-F08-AA]PMZ25668.1 hypothetical protein C1Y05_22200 [Pseudomonas sp. FW306-02-F04-BA]PMZ33235.1 hypothetical protein C1X99_17355 [Pseudomonas sp. FW306-02-H06B]PMZ45948.1 hypothetical protein C1Y03_15600 [Ps